MRKTLSRRIDFINISKQIPTFVCDFFILKIRHSIIINNGKYGIVASKKTFEHSAIKRNRAIRLIREWIRLNKEQLNSNIDYVFIARHKILESSLDTGLKYMKQALETANKNETKQDI